MKNLVINLSLISTLLISQSALSQEEVKPVDEPIETIVVVSTPEVAGFEVYSLEIAKNALNSTMKLMRDDMSMSLANSAALLIKSQMNESRAIPALFH